MQLSQCRMFANVNIQGQQKFKSNAQTSHSGRWKKIVASRLKLGTIVTFFLLDLGSQISNFRFCTNSNLENWNLAIPFLTH